MAMSKVQKDALTKNRVLMVRNIQIDEDFLSHMMESGKIITESMKEEIEARSTRQEKVGKLLEILPRRGPGTFETFIKALVYTHQEHISDALDKELSCKLVAERDSEMHVEPSIGEDTGDNPEPPRKSHEEMLAEIKNESMGVPLVAMVNPVSSSELNRLISEMNNERVYRVRGPTRGRAVIMNIEHFVRLRVREGSQEDVCHLEKLFTHLQFKVYKYDEQQLGSAESILKCLEYERTQTADHDAADMFVLCIMSHGLDGCIFASDGSTVQIRTIVDMFDGKNCTKLQNKPKLFFFQACQGKMTTVGISADTTDSPVSTTQSPQPVPSSSAAADAVDGPKPEQNRFLLKDGVHEKRDMLVGNSTVPGYVANRHTWLGSLYIRCLVYVFSRQAHKDHVVDMLTDVSNIMSKFRVAESNEVFAPEQRNTFNKRVYFMPGFSGFTSS